MNLRTDGPSDQWAFGPMDLQTNGPFDQEAFGPMTLLTNGPSDQWLFGPTTESPQKIIVMVEKKSRNGLKIIDTVKKSRRHAKIIIVTVEISHLFRHNLSSWSKTIVGITKIIIVTVKKYHRHG